MKKIFENEEYRVYEFERISEYKTSSKCLLLCGTFDPICMASISKAGVIFSFITLEGYTSALHKEYTDLLLEVSKKAYFN